MTFLSSLPRPFSGLTLFASLAALVGLASPAVGSAQSRRGADALRAERAAPTVLTADARRARQLRRSHRAEQRRGIMQQLGLTDAQRARIRTLRQEARAARRGNTPPERGALRAQIQAVLTPAQRAQAANLRRAHRAARIDGRVERMTERLALSTAQASRVRGILVRAARERQALGEQGDRASTRAARRALRQNTRTEMRSVLSESQFALLREARSERRAARTERRSARRAQR